MSNDVTEVDKDIARKNHVFSKASMYNISGDKEARLVVNGFKNFIRFSVLLLEKNEKPRFIGKIGFNNNTIYAIIDTLEDLKNHKEEFYTEFMSYSPLWVDNVMSKTEKQLNGSIIIGKKKDKDGNLVSYLTLKDEDSNKSFTFKFMRTPYVKILVNGKMLDPTEESDLWAKTHAQVLRALLDGFYETLPDKPYEKKDTNSDIKYFQL